MSVAGCRAFFVIISGHGACSRGVAQQNTAAVINRGEIVARTLHRGRRIVVFAKFAVHLQVRLSGVIAYGSVIVLVEILLRHVLVAPCDM